jgi:hypothetical protein
MPDSTQKGAAHHKDGEAVLLTDIQDGFHQL